VIDYFVGTYLGGRTPNPCVVCNSRIKFDLLMQKAASLGAEVVATGHYARKLRLPGGGRWAIRQGVDLSKDQSYVLAGLTQDQIKNALFPLGERTKTEVREMAKEWGFEVHDKPESQEICFIEGRYDDFLKSVGVDLPGEGEIVDLSGRVLGRHPGFYRFTIGQRKGLDISDRTPYYVVSIDPAANRIVVGKRAHLTRYALRLAGMNWMARPAVGNYEVKIRSRHGKTPARLAEFDDSTARVELPLGADAVTPGQAAVLYDGDTVLGGGWIES
ncbi:MAG: tRNA 2-thiouridine(34) synthase MnmA, partial [Candidatus Omnitrophica bacterium]|nr:tRNA 2-thiouridine(34) synthase MnmA [Candidatus Omnitrophota bacterium]